MPTPPSHALRRAGTKPHSPARLTACILAVLLAPLAAAQRHNGLSSPPTAPPPPKGLAGKAIVPVSTGMGALQFASVNYGVPAPQSLTRQLEADDDRTRAAALSAIGSPAQYLGRGHTPYPHSIQLSFVALGLTDELDAILTVELDQHIVSAVLMPHGDSWARIATLTYATSFANPSTTPATFLRIARSLMQHERYRAVYRATTVAANGDLTENEAHLRILNNKAVILISFASSARVCSNPKRPGCDITHRWLQPDPVDPSQHFFLVTANGHLSPHEAADPLASDTTFQQSHLHTFTCQPFNYSDTTERYEPTANPGPCTASAPQPPTPPAAPHEPVH
ncbi:hypothetical protein GOB94_04795 [Granulicella sp. 5B5]|uniref:hypothetical protein n=1 Tax=Granulicella sp. 5B5 TaxID=1617967 RepID=UPI0015F4956A|nr:hypothetical protein [Granulicella sp. 5B5]QMV18084.1 hypothetical protein GOB94_04795 [Granulicella sp. 5B5]